MNYKHIGFLFSFCFLVSSVFAGDLVLPKDITPADPASEAVLELIADGILPSGGEIRPSDVISKEHAAYFLAKVKGVENPTFEDVKEQKILSTTPDPAELLNYATLTKILCNTFDVPDCEAQDASAWFVPPFVIATGLGAVGPNDKPFDLVSRGDVFRMSVLYRKIFGAKKIDKIMDECEITLMRLRDMMLNAEVSDTEIRTLLWDNIMKAADIEQNARVDAIKHLNTVFLILLQKRSEPQNSLLQGRAEFFIKKAVEVLPGVAEFTKDLQKIAEQ